MKVDGSDPLFVEQSACAAMPCGIGSVPVLAEGVRFPIRAGRTGRIRVACHYGMLERRCIMAHYGILWPMAQADFLPQRTSMVVLHTYSYYI